MKITNDNPSVGTMVNLRTTDPLHFSSKQQRPIDDDVAGSFGDMLTAALSKVNNIQVESDKLTQQMIHAPESVDIHSVMIAGQKAEIAISFTKAVRDEVIRGYRELMNMR
ncbi:MAG TPA: flagellar hook-basal body complex protein FliE [Spirochaetota bacterium]|nr:flagellar hook-basal body complex protein FliE [Spirochaetota bacterium]